MKRMFCLISRTHGLIIRNPTIHTFISSVRLTEPQPQPLGVGQVLPVPNRITWSGQMHVTWTAPSSTIFVLQHPFHRASVQQATCSGSASLCMPRGHLRHPEGYSLSTAKNRTQIESSHWSIRCMSARVKQCRDQDAGTIQTTTLRLLVKFAEKHTNCLYVISMVVTSGKVQEILS